MHELGIALEVVEIAARRAEGARVRKVVLEIGKLAAVVPDSIRFCFDLCAAETPLAGAELAIVEVAGVARCRACSARIELDQPIGVCGCGSSDLEWLEGDDVRIRWMAVD